MRCQARNSARLSRHGRGLVLLLFVATRAFGAEPQFRQMSFADGRISCRIVAEDEGALDMAVAVLPIAMNAGLDLIGPPARPAHMTVRLQAAPTFLARVIHLFRPEPAAFQQDDDLSIGTEKDPLKLGFRLSHEFSHWLVQKQFTAQPPLWLDEGLASLAGMKTADTCARVFKRNLERPVSPRLEKNLFSIDELVALQDYPADGDRVAAFYWQAEALVNALREKLGPREFIYYLELMCSPETRDWTKPLRERWYFSDWDFQFLARQIRPGATNGAEPSHEP